MTAEPPTAWSTTSPKQGLVQEVALSSASLRIDKFELSDQDLPE